MVNTKAALQILWNDTCNIIEYQSYTDDDYSTSHREVTVLENQPCKLSFSTLQSANQTDTAAMLVQKAKLFIDSETVIKAGSKIEIQHNNRTFVYKNSGEAGVFTYHQEIILESFEGWA